jgi:hypothetical protein
MHALVFKISVLSLPPIVEKITEALTLAKKLDDKSSRGMPKPKAAINKTSICRWQDKCCCRQDGQLPRLQEGGILLP